MIGAFPAKDITLGNAGAALMLGAGATFANAPMLGVGALTSPADTLEALTSAD